MEMMSDSSFKKINENKTIEELYSIKKIMSKKLKNMNK